MKKKLKKFLGKRVYYDADGQMIWAEYKDKTIQMLLDVRGWGAIQQLFDNQIEAGLFQDYMGQWITDAINEKMKRDKKTVIDPDKVIITKPKMIREGGPGLGFAIILIIAIMSILTMGRI